MLDNIKVNEVPENIMLGYKTTIAGVPKSGKTTLFYELVLKELGSADQGLIIAFEKGYKAIQGAHVIDIPDWDAFRDLVDELVDEENLETITYKTLAIDVADIASRMARQWVVRKASIQDSKKYNKLNDIGYGGGHELLEDEFSEQMGRLERAGYGIFFITHHRDRQIEEKDGTTYDRSEVSLTGKTGQYIKGASDFIVFIDIDKEKDKKTGTVSQHRSIRFRGDATTEAGGRLTHLPESIPYDIDLFIETVNEAIRMEKEEVTKKVRAKKSKKKKVMEDVKVIDDSEDVAEDESMSPKEYKQTITSLLKEMSVDDRNAWKPRIKELTGAVNYNMCKDSEKLAELLKEIQAQEA